METIRAALDLALNGQAYPGGRTIGVYLGDEHEPMDREPPTVVLVPQGFDLAAPEADMNLRPARDVRGRPLQRTTDVLTDRVAVKCTAGTYEDARTLALSALSALRAHLGRSDVRGDATYSTEPRGNGYVRVCSFTATITYNVADAGLVYADIRQVVENAFILTTPGGTSNG